MDILRLLPKDQYDAALAANAPTAANPFATIADLTGDGIYGGSGTVPTLTVATLTDSLTFKGADDLAASKAFLYQNASSEDLFVIYNDGDIRIGNGDNGRVGINADPYAGTLARLKIVHSGSSAVDAAYFQGDTGSRAIRAAAISGPAAFLHNTGGSADYVNPMLELSRRNGTDTGRWATVNLQATTAGDNTNDQTSGQLAWQNTAGDLSGAQNGKYKIRLSRAGTLTDVFLLDGGTAGNGYVNVANNFAIGKNSGIDAKLIVKGNDSVFTGRAFEVENLAGTVAVTVRNDGFVGINKTAKSASERMHISGVGSTVATQVLYMTNGIGQFHSIFYDDFQVLHRGTLNIGSLGASTTYGINIDNSTFARGINVDNTFTGATNYGAKLNAAGTNASDNIALELSAANGGAGNVYALHTTNTAPLSINTLSNNSLVNVNGDIEVYGSANGIILVSPDLTRWRGTVDNTGALTFTSL